VYQAWPRYRCCRVRQRGARRVGLVSPSRQGRSATTPRRQPSSWAAAPGLRGLHLRRYPCRVQIRLQRVSAVPSPHMTSLVPQHGSGPAGIQRPNRHRRPGSILRPSTSRSSLTQVGFLTLISSSSRRRRLPNGLGGRDHSRGGNAGVTFGITMWHYGMRRPVRPWQ
jgi:hypothetical protein